MLKIYGERNTGTNYLEKLIQENIDIQILEGKVPLNVQRLIKKQKIIDVETWRDFYFCITYKSNLGWKHSLPCIDGIEQAFRKSRYKNKLFIITLSKNPYSWLLSLYKRPYHSVNKTETFEEFLSTPWPTLKRENCECELLTPIEMWNMKNKRYLTLKKRLKLKSSVINLRYEDLLENPKGVVQQIIKLSLGNENETLFQNVESSVKNDKEKNFSFYKKYYLNELWRKEIKLRDIEKISSKLDFEVMEDLKYELG